MIQNSRFSYRTPDQSRARCPGIAGPAVPKQRDCRQIIHFHGYGEIPPEKHLPEARHHQPPGGGRESEEYRDSQEYLKLVFACADQSAVFPILL